MTITITPDQFNRIRLISREPMHAPFDLFAVDAPIREVSEIIGIKVIAMALSGRSESGETITVQVEWTKQNTPAPPQP